MKRVWIALLVPVALVAACTGAPSGAPDDLARLVPLAGGVTVVRGGEQIVATEELTLGAGDVVSTSDGGAARLVLPGEQSLELAPGTSARMQARPGPRLLEGDLLALAGEDGLVIQAGDDDLLARSSVFRVQRQFSTTVGVYEGGVTVDNLDQVVPALRRLTIGAGGNLPEGLQPLVVDPSDPWDGRFLGPAIDIGLGIDRLKQGLAAQLAGRRGAGVVADLLTRDYGTRLVRSLLEQAERSELADVVVAGRLATPAAARVEKPAARVLEQMIDLRLSEEAQWIVIVAQWQLFNRSLLDSLASLIGVVARAVAPPAAGGGAPGGGVIGPPQAGPGPAGQGGEGPGGGDGGGNGGGDPPSPPPPPPECDDPVECVVDDLLDTANAL